MKFGFDNVAQTPKPKQSGAPMRGSCRTQRTKKCSPSRTQKSSVRTLSARKLSDVSTLELGLFSLPPCQNSGWSQARSNNPPSCLAPQHGHIQSPSWKRIQRGSWFRSDDTRSLPTIRVKFPDLILPDQHAIAHRLSLDEPASRALRRC